MEQFSLEKYLTNPSRKVVTGDGRNARIICTDRRDLTFPIIALIENKSGGGETTLYYTKYGKYNLNGCLSNYDLLFAPEKHEGWVNIYRGFIYGDYTSGGYIFDSEEKAKECGDDAIATVKVEWEE